MDLDDLKINRFDDLLLDKKICKGSSCKNYRQCLGKNFCKQKIDDSYLNIKLEIINNMNDWLNKPWRRNLDELKKIVRIDKLKRNEYKNIKKIEIIFTIFQLTIVAFLISYIWIRNFDFNSLEYKLIASILGIFPIILKKLEDVIKNLYVYK